MFRISCYDTRMLSKKNSKKRIFSLILQDHHTPQIKMTNENLTSLKTFYLNIHQYLKSHDTAAKATRGFGTKGRRHVLFAKQLLLIGKGQL